MEGGKNNQIYLSHSKSGDSCDQVINYKFFKGFILMCVFLKMKKIPEAI